MCMESGVTLLEMRIIGAYYDYGAMEHYDGGGNVFFEPTVNILIFCSSVVGSYLKESVPLFQISIFSAQPPPVRGRGPGRHQLQQRGVAAGKQSHLSQSQADL